MDKSTFSILFIMQKGKPNAQGNAPIFARITINHQMTHLATRYYLPADRWLPKEGRTIGRTKEEKDINAYLDNLRGLIYSKYNENIMATVKVKLRPSSVNGKAGVIFYQITQNRRVQQITTKLRVSKSDWNADEERLLLSAQNRTMIQHCIDSDVALLRRAIFDLDNSGMDYSVEDVISRYKSPQSHILVLDYMSVQIEQLKATNRLGTAKNYEKVRSSFGAFLGDVKLPLSALLEPVIMDYNAFLVQRGLVRNSVSFYMRVMRAVYNKAVRQKLIEQQYPFTEVYTGIDKTRKRAVPEAIITQMYRLKLEADTPLALCRDMFIFSYCTRGMAFVDIAYLRRSNLQNGVICYTRRKTGQLLTIRIEPSIQQIIDRYADSDSPYLFPILNSLNAVEAYEQYQIALNSHNRLLGRLSDILGCGCKLTSYTSRHSWATAARNHNVPISVISQGMGHTSETHKVNQSRHTGQLFAGYLAQYARSTVARSYDERNKSFRFVSSTSLSRQYPRMPFRVCNS